MSGRAAATLVFWTNAAVLVVELAALRLLAPYLGLTLETNTLVIGLALAAIAAGSWLGGRVADAVPPRRLLGVTVGVAGAVVALTPLAVRSAGATGDGTLLVGAAAATIMVPGALLAAVTPMVTKLRLTSLSETGTVVGRLSGIGTAGAIAGTVVTGFVLITRAPVSTILVGLGIALLATAVLVDAGVRGWGRGSRVACAALVAAGGLGATAGPGGCDVETTYHCAVVTADPQREGGRVLVLDGLRHSYVALGDPTHLEFEYVRALASVADSAFPPDEPVRAHHLGGGGMTVPRYLARVRPGSVSTVSEIDAGVVGVDRDRLGLRPGNGIHVRVEDARLGLDRLAGRSVDLVVGDAFGGLSVPFHLTTVEALRQVRGVLATDGVYAANLIDHGRLAFARAEIATLGRVFRHVVLLGDPATLARRDGPGSGGNMVAVASDRPVDTAALRAALERRGTGWGTLDGDRLRRWTGDAEVLTDDHAPVDQLLTPYPPAPPPG